MRSGKPPARCIEGAALLAERVLLEKRPMDQALHASVLVRTPKLGKLRTERESDKQETIMRVVIVAESGRLREGLQAMLDSLPTLETVAVADDGPSALEAIQSGRPDLVILDAHLFGESTAGWIRAIKQGWNGTHCIVVADRLGQFQPLLDAGADAVLLKGFSAAELRTAVEQL